MPHPTASISLPGMISTRTAAVTTRVRIEKVETLARLAPILALSSLCAAATLIALFWHQGPHRFLVGLGVGLLLVHGAAICKSVLWLGSARPSTLPPRSVWLRAGVTAAVAAIWGTVPIVLMPQASAEDRQLIVYVMAGLISAGVMIAPMRAGAVAFSTIVGLGELIAILIVHDANFLQHAGTVLVYLAATICVILYLHARFVSLVAHEVQLLEQRELIGLLLKDFEETASDWLWETGLDGRFTHLSERLAQVADMPMDALQQLSLLAVGAAAADRGHAAGDQLLDCHAQRLPFRDLVLPVQLESAVHWWSLTGKPIYDGQSVFIGYRGVGTDVTSARRSEDRIAYLACYDSLTDLSNRVMFQDRLRQVCAEGKPFALLSLDLDGFKSVNDTLGHAAGDALLRAVARRIRNCVREHDVVGRLGGDEFAILQLAADAAHAAELARRIIERISEVYNIDGCTAGIGVSIGIMMPTSAAEPPTELLKGADLALYRAKAEGRGTWRFFDSEMDAVAEARRRLQSDLRQALEHDEFALHFQPIISLATSDVEVVEALLRWTHPQRGAVAPSDFIPIAEESGLILPIGTWVLREACRQAMLLPDRVRVAVNLSPAQLRDPRLLTLVDEALRQTGLPPGRLELEITETIFLDASTTVLATLHALHARGVHVALDDFGTGYSSLSYLRSFSFNKVKIDRSFVRDLGDSAEANAIVKAITGMADSLGIGTTAEGVENQEQLDLLRSSGCAQVQGFLFSRAMPIDSIVQLISDRSRIDRGELEAVSWSGAILADAVP